MIAYATSPGEFALDGTPGGNSPYASSLAKAINRADNIETVFKETRIETLRRTSGKQVPWESSSLFSAVTFQVSPLQPTLALASGAPQNANALRPQTVTAPPPASVVTPSAQASSQSVHAQNPVKPPQQSEGGQPLSTAGVQVASNTTPSSSMLLNNFADSFAGAYDELSRVIKLAPLSSFVRWDGKAPSERDRSDFLMTVQIRGEMATGKAPRGVVFSLIDTLQRGVINPF